MTTTSVRVNAILLILIAFLVLVVGLNRALPLVIDADESTFVEAAVRVASSGDLNPGFFGHPGATTIYPLAVAYRIWYTLAQLGQPLTTDPNLSAHYQNALGQYYWLGRLLAVFYALIALALTFALGKRTFGAPVGIAAGWLTAFHSIAIYNAKQARTDSAATAFGLLTLWFILLLLDDATNIRRIAKIQLAAGIAIGFAIASRFYMAIMVIVLALADIMILWRARQRTPLLGWMLAGFLVIPLAFLIASPAILPHWQEALETMLDETVTVHLGADGMTPIQNFGWYLGTALPDSITWLQMAAAVAGLVVAFARKRRQTLLLLVFVVVTLLGVSVSPRHFQRYVIQVLPIIAIFAAVAIDAAAHSLARWRNWTPRAGTLLFAGGILILLANPASRVIRLDIQHSGEDTRVLAREWLLINALPADRILQENYSAALNGSGLLTDEIRSLPDIQDQTAARSAYTYWVASSAIYDRYFAEPERYAAQVALYESLFDSQAQVAIFPATWYRNGPTLRIFRTEQMPP